MRRARGNWGSWIVEWGEVVQACSVKHVQGGRDVFFVWTILLTSSNVRRHPFLILTTLLPVRSSSFLSLGGVSTGGCPVETPTRWVITTKGPRTDLVKEGHELLGILICVGVVHGGSSAEAGDYAEGLAGRTSSVQNPGRKPDTERTGGPTVTRDEVLFVRW
jgi:hypothetical protein